MHDLIIPPEPPLPKRRGPPAKLPVEIVIDRRGNRPVRYGLIAALIGLAGLAATHFYAPDRSKDATVQKAETQAPQQVTIPVLDEASKRRIAALQDEVQELRTKLDAVEKRQQADSVRAQPAASPPPPAAENQAAAVAAKAAPVTRLPEKGQPKVARAAGKENVDMTPVQTIAPAPKVVSGYRVRDVYHGAALIESDRGMIGVEPGEVVPGVGRVMAIQERGGRWVVVTESGEILGNARGQSRAAAPRQRQFARELDGFEPGPFEPPMFPRY
ncbi:MAG: hypothetical protein HZC06_14150 [Methylocystis sp.]|nr:hypothetical protein [Methylocystis sp.]MBI5313815.1 hypothetical protein [Methylocystis sp.]